MTTAVVQSPAASAFAPPSLDSSTARSYPPIAPQAISATGTPKSNKTASPTNTSPVLRTVSDGDKSSPSSRLAPPKVFVKKEPISPEMSTPRHRPRRLDLSKGSSGSIPAGPRTAVDGLAIKDVGLACLSPGFHTQDPSMQEQLQRSMSVREQQRLLIEARHKGTPASTRPTPPEHAAESNMFHPAKTPGTSKRKGPPPGLSIAPPSHEAFANEHRVVQSAPLHQTFTGLQRNHPLSRNIPNQPSSLANTSHVHHVHATQTNNRLPPIADVFAGDNIPAAPQSSRAAAFPHNSGHTSSPGHSSHSNVQPPMPSPGLPPPHAQQPSTYPPPSVHGPQFSQPQPARPREFRSAEEALKEMTGGREELLPRLVHYGGHQPPTPPSPMPSHRGPGVQSAAPHVGRRRDREEFERDMSPQQQGRRRPDEGFSRGEREAKWVEGRWPNDSPETRERKKDEFLSLCSRAWDLFHS